MVVRTIGVWIFLAQNTVTDKSNCLFVVVVRHVNPYFRWIYKNRLNWETVSVFCVVINCLRPSCIAIATVLLFYVFTSSFFTLFFVLFSYRFRFLLLVATISLWIWYWTRLSAGSPLRSRPAANDPTRVRQKQHQSIQAETNEPGWRRHPAGVSGSSSSRHTASSSNRT